MKKIIGILALLVLVGSIATVTETKDVSAVWITGRTTEVEEEEEPDIKEDPDAYLDEPRTEKYITRSNLGKLFGLKRLPNGTNMRNTRRNGSNAIVITLPKNFKA